MSTYWFLAALAAVCISNVHSNTPPAGRAGKTEVSVDAVVGYKPCVNAFCEYGPSELEPKPASESSIENPKVHCIMLRPSAVKTFGEVESAYPGISDIKYQLFEELVDHMYAFTSFKLENCQPAMQLIELIILAGNSLKAQYTLQGGEDCVYESSANQTEKPLPSDKVTEMPCQPETSGYVTGASTICPGSTMKPEIPPVVTEKPYVPSSTTEKPYVPTSTKQPVTEKPYVPSSTTEKPYVPPSTKQPVTEKPYIPMPTKQPATEEPPKTCPDGVTTEKPCHPAVDTVTEEYSSEEIEIVAEDEPYVKIPQVGSMRGIPGVHYPNYTEIPITSFTCADKKYVPGFYADPETACQVFHVCYEHRRESFLCPVGTIFNQPILACDYWYSSDCSLACDYYNVNERTELEEAKIDEEVEELLTAIAESEKPEEDGTKPSDVESDLDEIVKFFPVKAVVTEIKSEVKVVPPATPKPEEIASEIVDKMATTATKVISTTRDIVKSIPEPVEPILKPAIPVKPVLIPASFPHFVKPMKMQDMLKQTVVPIAKAKLAAIPVSKVTALKTAIPVAAKTKVVIPVVAAKAKLATKVAAIPAIKAAAAAPVIAKAKLAAAIPVAKAAVAVPLLAKAKIAVPAAKVAVAAPVLAKAKVAVAAPIIAKAKVAVPAAKVAVAAPVLAKAKVAVAAPIIAKGKIAVPAVKMAAAKVAVKSSIPALKAKMFASAVPLAKAKIIPLMKAKVVKGASTPLLKAKMLALPLAKSKLAGPLPIAKIKLAKAAAVSPLTKKALVLGLLKAKKFKKLALMG